MKRLEKLAHTERRSFYDLPNSIKNWSVLILSLALISIVALSSLINFPTRIIGKIKLESVNNVWPTITRGSGNLILFIENQDSVIEGQIIGYLSNETEIEIVDKIERAVKDSSLLKGVFQMGEFLSFYERYSTALNELRGFKEQSRYSAMMDILSNEIMYKSRRIEGIEKQLKLGEDKYYLAQKNFKTDSLLESRGVLDSYTLNIRHIELVGLIGETLGYANEINRVKAEREELRREKVQLEESYQNRLETLISNYNEYRGLLLTELVNWRWKYELTANQFGVANMPIGLNSGKFYTEGTTIVSVVSAGTPNDIRGQMSVAAAYFNDIKLGQEVLISLDATPAEKIGVIRGEVDKISLKQDSLIFWVQVKLKEGLKTTNGERIKFVEEMTGEANIISKKYTLMERLFFYLKEQDQSEYLGL